MNEDRKTPPMTQEQIVKENRELDRRWFKCSTKKFTQAQKQVLARKWKCEDFL